MHQNKQENTKKMPIFSMYQMNRDVVVVCNHTGSCIIIKQHCIDKYLIYEHSTIVGPSISHLSPFFDRWLGQNLISNKFYEMFGHQMVLCHHEGTHVRVVWHYLGIKKPITFKEP